MAKTKAQKMYERITYGVLILVFSFFIVGMSIVYYEYNVLLNRTFEFTKGVAVERMQGRKSAIEIKCRYVVNAKIYIQFVKVNYIENKYDCYFDEGDSVIVKYYPPDPSISEIEIERSYLRWKRIVYKPDSIR